MGCHMSEVLVSIDDNGVALITLNAPERRNSMNLDMVEEIVAIVEQCVADDNVGALVVTGEGKGFCAGATLDHLAGSSGPSESRGVASVYDGFLVFQSCAKPTIAAVNGSAVGAGMNLALGVRPSHRVDEGKVHRSRSSISASIPVAATPGCCSAPWARRWPGPWCCSARNTRASKRRRSDSPTSA